MATRTTYFKQARVSRSHKTLLDEAERRGILNSINQGKRTLAEQAVFYANYLRNGWPKAAKPTPAAPHIKFCREAHALDIDDGVVDRVAAMYVEFGVPVAFNVPGEPWHMDTLDEQKLVHAAASLRGEKGILATIRPGMLHADVLYARSLLRRGGYMAPGRNRVRRYGVEMATACRRCQRDKGLKPDGVIGPATWKILRALPARRTPVHISKAGRDFIKAHEGLRLEAYKPDVQPPEKFWTIGYGHYGSDVKQGQKITQADADKFFAADIAPLEKIMRSVKIPLSDAEMTAGVSLGYNIGANGLRTSTFVKRLNAGDRKGAANAILFWNKPAVLEERREDERKLFLSS